MAWTAAAALLAMLVAFVGSNADEPAAKDVSGAPKIGTPFDADTMPPADELIGDNPLKSSRWTAEISITADSADSPESNSQVDRPVAPDVVRFGMNANRAAIWTKAILAKAWHAVLAYKHHQVNAAVATGRGIGR